MSLQEASARKGSLLGTMKAVGWAFFGVRRTSEHARDVERLNPVHVVIVGVLAAVLFVIALVILVNVVVASGAAA